MLRYRYAPRLLESSGYSCVGAVREANADQFLIADLSSPFSSLRQESDCDHPVGSASGAHGHLLLVADGIGTGPGGSDASRIVVDVLSEYLTTRGGRQEKSDAQTLGNLVDQLRRSQQEMSRLSLVTSILRMGTTVTMACVLGSTLHVIHAGDSRCYLLRGGRLTCLTTDHTLAQQLVDHRCLTTEMARSSRLQHVLWNAITADSPSFELETVARKLRRNDTLLLCSDGLTKHLEDADLLALAGGNDPPQVITRRLVDTALAAGGSDNITVVVARYQPLAAAPVPTSRLHTDVAVN
ncbi:MAG: serine/threonine-protein phosphatase [Pirellulaceae bacterium]|nr:serine/threonine-protein phosphatase [Pirellulaceae bacterium]